MSEFFAWLFVIALVVGLAMGLLIGNDKWNCTSYHNATGADTKMIAGSCYVNDHNQWVTYDSYVNRHRVNVSDTDDK